MSMTFEQFRNNVESWAEARGIYAHSTAMAQALKAVSEVGELADAVIKNDRPALVDAIGDVAVCLVNVSRMTDNEISNVYPHTRKAVPLMESACSISGSVGELASLFYAGCVEYSQHYLDQSFCDLVTLCYDADLDFLHCCESAWNEIKDRKGHMVAGGAFVKEGA